MPCSFVLHVLVLAALLLLATQSRATARPFMRSHETADLVPGTVEIRTSATARSQPALHLDWAAEGQGGDAAIRAHLHHRGVSSRWKYEPSDPASSVRSALYLDLLQGPAEAAFKGRLLVDKRVGPWNLVVNGVYKFEHKFASAINEHKVFGTAGLGYFVTEKFSIGMEVMDCNIFEPDAPGGASALKHGALYGGPVLSYARRNWWAAISVTPQVHSYGNALEGNDRRRNPDEFEKVQGRFRFGVHL